MTHLYLQIKRQAGLLETSHIPSGAQVEGQTKGQPTRSPRNALWERLENPACEGEAGGESLRRQAQAGKPQGKFASAPKGPRALRSLLPNQNFAGPPPPHPCRLAQNPVRRALKFSGFVGVQLHGSFFAASNPPRPKLV